MTPNQPPPSAPTPRSAPSGSAPSGSTSSADQAASRAAFEGLWEDLHAIGRDGASGGYRRFAWTREDHTLREWFAGQAAQLGLDLVEDRAGNQWAFWGDPDAPGAQKAVVTGSHLDSVPDGGAFDGPLGVVSSLLAIRALQERGFRPSRPIAVVNFGDEEGARFGIACAGSRIITGVLEADRARGLRDAQGVSLAEAWERAGRDPGSIGTDPRMLARIGVFVELHVEQGRALAEMDPATSAVAVGTDIWPHGRWHADLPGRADHAGTTALADRDDAMLKAARLIEGARAAAQRRDRSAEGGDRVVATVGKIDVRPGGVNAIPSHVRAWVDARGSAEQDVRDTVAELRGLVQELGGSFEEESWTPTTRFDAALIDRVQQAISDSTGGSRVPLLGTGAGHDAGILANHGVPVAMIFVRNPSGTSHTPAEFAEVEDCLRGVEALTAALADLAA